VLPGVGHDDPPPDGPAGQPRWPGEDRDGSPTDHLAGGRCSDECEAGIDDVVERYGYPRGLAEAVVHPTVGFCVGLRGGDWVVFGEPVALDRLWVRLLDVRGARLGGVRALTGATGPMPAGRAPYFIDVRVEDVVHVVAAPVDDGTDDDEEY
jgi:hypothetical protein